MVTNEIRNSLKLAADHLKVTGEEMNRPMEDVVTLAVCQNARQSMHTLMQLYLMSHSTGTYENLSLEALLEQCKKKDHAFNAIDLHSVLCHEMNRAECDGTYCLTHRKVGNCVYTANEIKNIVLDKLGITESEII